MNCSNCGEEVPDSHRECLACGADNGFPNVRLAASDAEVNALQERYSDARISADARTIAAEIIAFEEAVKNSKAVISRPLADIQALAQGDEFSYASFAKQVRAGTRSPTDNVFDKTRVQFENALFPNFFENILFGSISLEERGMRGYGGYDMVFKDNMISHRASVFEENPYNFATKHHIGMTGVFPPGYRATWYNRHTLAVSKLHSAISEGMGITEFAGVLQKDEGGTGNSDFVEVHIYGTINRKTIEKVVASGPITREDKLLWRVCSRKLEAAGVETLTK